MLSNPNFYSTFKRKITLAFELERRIEENKFSKDTIRQARRQYLVYLVSCLESYLEELFKRYIDFELVDFQKLLKMKRLKQIRFNIYDLFDFNKNNIRLSEIIIAYLNFQNIDCILDFCDVIEFNKYVSKLPILNNAAAFVFSKIAFDKLPAEYQKIALEGAKVGAKHANSIALEEEDKALKAMKDSGIEMVFIEDFTPFIELTEPVSKKYLKKMEPWVSKVREDIMALSNK